MQPGNPPAALEPDEPGHRVRHHAQLGLFVAEDLEAGVGHLHDPAGRDQRGRDPGARARADPARDEERVETSQLFDQTLQVSNLRNFLSNKKLLVSRGWLSTEVAFMLHTQQPGFQFPAFPKFYQRRNY